MCHSSPVLSDLLREDITNPGWKMHAHDSWSLRMFFFSITKPRVHYLPGLHASALLDAMRAGHISLALAAVVSGTHIHDEDPNCPCVPGPVAESTTGCTEIRVPLGIGNTLYPEPFLPLASMCYPAAYGSSCSAWDEGLVPFCSRANAPSYCGSEWCYVDGERCRQGSNVPVSRSYLFPADEYGDVHYSYATCTYNISSPRGAWQSSPPSPALLAAANSVRGEQRSVPARRSRVPPSADLWADHADHADLFHART